MQNPIYIPPLKLRTIPAPQEPIRAPVTTITPITPIAAPSNNNNTNSVPQTYQQALALATTLKEIVLKQQILINALMLDQQKHNNNEQKETSPVSLKPKESFHIKVEDIPSINSDHVNISTDNSSEASGTISEEQEATRNAIQIIRRNGFKAVRSDSKKDSSDSEEEGLEGSQGKGRKNPSKAKHLWVNYGRRIIEYAITQTKGDMQERVKQIIGRLNSKKDFENVFQIRDTDTAEDRLFKTLVGRQAIFFVKHKANASFEGSKYKDQMITQRHVVAAWIERLICE